MLLSGIRTGKSLFVAMLACYWSQTADLSTLRPGEVPRISILSVDKDKASVVLNHLTGSIQASPALRAIYVGEFKNEAVSGVILKHPSGRHVEIAVVAGSRAGSTLVSRWSAGCIFDECARMAGADDSVLNLEDARASVLGRILPGSSIAYVSSPWAPMGPVYDMVNTCWGAPRPNLVILKAPGPLMNPGYWSPEKCEEIKEQDPQVYRTDVLAEFSNLDENLYPSDLLDACVRREPIELPYDESCDYCCATDPATRGNAWPVIIYTKIESKIVIVCYWEYKGTKGRPLNPGEVFSDIASRLRTYKVDTIITDQFAADALRSIADQHRLHLISTHIDAKNKLEMFEQLKIRLIEGTIELANDPMLLKDLRLVKKQVNQKSMSIILPRTPDKRHCDGAAALALAMSRAPREQLLAGPKPGTPEFHLAWALKHKQEIFDKAKDRNRRENAFEEDPFRDPEHRSWWEKPVDE